MALAFVGQLLRQYLANDALTASVRRPEQQQQRTRPQSHLKTADSTRASHNTNTNTTSTMSSSIPLQLAETIQTAHIQRDPSPQHDLNPSTAASRKEPVRLEAVYPGDDGGIDEDDEIVTAAKGERDEEFDEDESETEDEDLYRSRVKPRPRRRHHLPPMPDLRFEQSYLSSIRNADVWWKVGWITVRDQVMMPFVQGIAYNLVLCGWQYWNRNAQIHGSSIGARLRRWWYGVNNWQIPPPRKVGRVR